jgi:hypothetical protein
MWSLVSGTTEVEYMNGWGKWHHEVTFSDGTGLAPRHVIVSDEGYFIPDGKSRDEKVPTKRQLELDFRCNSVLPPDADFTLTAFDLPEPMGMPPVSRGYRYWYLWFLLAGAGLLAAGLLLRWRLADRKKGALPTASNS